jgi:hypothetical protein
MKDDYRSLISYRSSLITCLRGQKLLQNDTSSSITIIGRAGAFGRDHRRSQGMVGRATRAKDRTLVGLLLSLQDLSRDALRRLFGDYSGHAKAAVSVELPKRLAESPTAIGYLADPAPFSRHDLKDIVQHR